MTIPQAPSFSADPLGSFDLDTLLSGAARLRGDRMAVSDGTASLTFADLDARATAIALAWMDMGLSPGETLLVVAAPRVSTITALVAGLRAGLRVALSPLHRDAAELGALARASGAVALVGDAAFGTLAPVDDCLRAAATAPGVRLVCTLGTETTDGAVALDPAVLAAGNGPHARATARNRCALLTFDARGLPLEHRQRTLVAAGLDLLARARIGMRLPIASTIAPASFAGMVTGPIASFLAGAPLHLHGPFEADAFAARIGRIGPCHLVVPQQLVGMCEAAGLVSSEKLASVLALSRAASPALLASPQRLAPARGLPPIVDIYAIGEIAAVPEPRGSDGHPAELCAEPHYISIDERRILAAGRTVDDAPPGIEGAAVSLPGTAA